MYNEFNPVFDYGVTKLFLSSGVIGHIEVKTDLGKQYKDALNTCKNIKNLNHDASTSIGFMIEAFWNSISLTYPDYKKKELLLTGFWFLLNESELWNKILND